MNKISDIKVFERVNFEKLKTLDLSYNNIDEKAYSSLINNLEKKINYLRIN